MKIQDLNNWIDFAKTSVAPEMPHALLTEFAKKNLVARNWMGYLATFGSHKCMVPFLSIQRQMTDAEYWPTLADLWIGSEWSVDLWQLWRWLFLSNRDPRGVSAMMNAKDLAIWNALPERFAVWRGQRRPRDPRHFSWTLSRERAVFFATRYRPRFTARWKAGDGVLLFGQVEKKNALALLNGRNELEVIVPPGKIRGVRLETP